MENSIKYPEGTRLPALSKETKRYYERAGFRVIEAGSPDGGPDLAKVNQSFIAHFGNERLRLKDFDSEWCFDTEGSIWGLNLALVLLSIAVFGANLIWPFNSVIYGFLVILGILFWFAINVTFIVFKLRQFLAVRSSESAHTEQINKQREREAYEDYLKTALKQKRDRNAKELEEFEYLIDPGKRQREIEEERKAQKRREAIYDADDGSGVFIWGSYHKVV